MHHHVGREEEARDETAEVAVDVDGREASGHVVALSKVTLPTLTEKDMRIEKKMTRDTIRMRQQRISGERSRAFQLTNTSASRVAMRPKIEVEAPTAPNLVGPQRALNKFPPILYPVSKMTLPRYEVDGRDAQRPEQFLQLEANDELADHVALCRVRERGAYEDVHETGVEEDGRQKALHLEVAVDLAGVVCAEEVQHHDVWAEELVVVQPLIRPRE